MLLSPEGYGARRDAISQKGVLYARTDHRTAERIGSHKGQKAAYLEDGPGRHRRQDRRGLAHHRHARRPPWLRRGHRREDLPRVLIVAQKGVNNGPRHIADRGAANASS